MTKEIVGRKHRDGERGNIWRTKDRREISEENRGDEGKERQKVVSER